MAWFNEFRNEHGFTAYPDNPTPVTLDIPLVAVTYFCVLLAIATIIAALGIRGRERWSCVVRASYAVAIGSIILVCICGHGWMEGQVTMTSPYVYRSNLPFNGLVGINVALHGTNVTLDGIYHGASGTGHVYFVESVPWADYGHLRECFSEFLHRGLPEPILKVVEFLTVDEGGLRWGRSFHTAGHYAGVLLWTAFAFWIICNVLLFSVVIYGAYMFMLTGLSMVLSCVAYHSCQNSQPLVIYFGGQELHISYGWCFWLTLTAGLITLLLGVILIVLDHFVHDSVSEFFHLEKLDEDEIVDCGPKDDSKCGATFIDRRGTVIPPTDMRRGSIFLEPGRRPSWYSDNMRRAVNFRLGGSLGGISNTGFEMESKSNKINPFFCSDEKAPSIPQADYSDDELKVDKDDNQVSASTRKPSLATLKEHRENHVNERRSSFGSTGVSSPTKENGAATVHFHSPTMQRRKGSLDCVINLEKSPCSVPIPEEDDATFKETSGVNHSVNAKRSSVCSLGFKSAELNRSDSSDITFNNSPSLEITTEAIIEVPFTCPNSAVSNESQRSNRSRNSSGGSSASVSSRSKRDMSRRTSVDSGQETCDDGCEDSIPRGSANASRTGSARSTDSSRNGITRVEVNKH